MNTLISLVFFDCPKDNSNPLSDMNGPLLFQSYSAAQDYLMAYLRRRIANHYVDQLAEDAGTWGIDLFDYTDDTEDNPMTSEEAFNLLMGEQETLFFELLTSWYKTVTQGEARYFDYKITEVPTASFTEELHQADAIEVHGNFIRHFHLTPEEDINSDDDILLDATLTTEDMDKLEYYVSVHEANTATFDSTNNCWNVGDLNIRLVQFKPSLTPGI